ncbi:hypothetical protein BHS09_09055 [Myxococcus xanthus]|uniref:Uncharacterized protein n=1 Tax=Myxococcus xanthus TaxID=34 RepID=A0AAE6KRG8_MYXXA|nr:UPF0489 family protein [Myxococcus xanthus]QDE67134.1 hypothetical protein BHS09_09055 [Myxococcus xanthus]QDE74409.1 hypothetical protein BHS08_09065 [Myxococcus xanthus]
MREVDFSQLKADDEFLSDLGADVWLMDNHRWAFLVWTRFGRERGIERFSLIHADHHWDGVNDFYEREEERARLLAADLVEIEAMVRNKEFIQFDSFIAPAVIRKLVTEVHFFCRQTDTEVGLDEQLLIATGARQYVHNDPGQLASVRFEDPIIFDLCLDLFNRTNKWATGDLWTDDEIDGFLQNVRPVIERADLVTVSLSFDYSGTAADTRHLAGLVVPRIVQWRSTHNC